MKRRISIPVEIGEKIECLIHEKTIAIFPRETYLLLDGFTYTLIIGEFMNQITLTWQGEAEGEWSVLNELVELIFGCLPEGIRRS